MKNWILNGDDYGLTPGVGRGIRRAFRDGILSTTTAMMNLPDAAPEVTLARADVPALPIGVHLCLTFGAPLTPPDVVPSLVDRQGRFFRRADFLNRLENIRLEDVEREWRAQIEVLIALGVVPDHLDSHHHVSYLTPRLLERMLRLAEEYRLAVRPPNSCDADIASVFAGLPESSVSFLKGEASSAMGRSSVRTADGLYLSFFGDTAKRETLLHIINTFPEGTGEIMCHPAEMDDQLLSLSDYAKERAGELSLIIDPAIRKHFDSMHINRTSYVGLAR
jgi:predicted glycoside hydrolase/deacetylase ChbG (UPF0249 family)